MAVVFESKVTPPFYILVFTRSGDPDEDGFGETMKYAFAMDDCAASTKPISVRLREILMCHFERGETHFSDGFEQIIAKLCLHEHANVKADLRHYFDENLTEDHLWTSNTNFGKNYLVFDFKQV